MIEKLLISTKEKHTFQSRNGVGLMANLYAMSLRPNTNDGMKRHEESLNALKEHPKTRGKEIRQMGEAIDPLPIEECDDYVPLYSCMNEAWALKDPLYQYGMKSELFPLKDGGILLIVEEAQRTTYFVFNGDEVRNLVLWSWEDEAADDSDRIDEAIDALEREPGFFSRFAERVRALVGKTKP